MALRTLLCSLLLSAVSAGAALAETAPFDLSGPNLKVTVTHAGATLPIWQAPALAAGDVVEIHPDFPESESAHYLMVLAFLRGATNPPPKGWFHRVETWGKHRHEGIKVKVPDGAEQAVVFLAPATGGDYKTLVSAVRGRPGAFVRAALALHQAGLDRSRLNTFLAAVRRGAPDDPNRLKTIAPLLTRSLLIKLNQDCLYKTPELQAACLTAGADSLVLDDGHSPSMVETLTSGDTAGLALSVASTPNARFGYYSAYLAAVMDMAHILNTLRTAQYQYIAALPSGQDDELSLLLNAAPSFHNPKSVLVTSLPLVDTAQPPPLQAIDPKAAYCLARTDLVLPVEGAPLAFSTGYARNLFIRIKDPHGREVELPATPDAEQGGLVVDTSAAGGLPRGQNEAGVLVGDWGFQPFEGPHFHLQTSAAGQWKLPADEANSVIAGRTDKTLIAGGGPACVESVSLKQGGDEPVPLSWKATPDGALVTLPLADAKPGAMTLLVKQYGAAAEQAIPVTAFAEAARLNGFELHVGDTSGVLEGERLDEVKQVKFSGLTFSPGELTSKGGKDELVVQADDASALGQLTAGEAATAQAVLLDGRKLSLRFKVAPPRPAVELISKNVQAPGHAASLGVKLTSADELPQNSQLTFSVRADGAARFTPQSVIEVATVDGSASVELKAGGALTIEDPNVGVASLDLGSSFGSSVFGALRFRLVDPGGTSDWRPLGTLVRVPELKKLDCRKAHGEDCTLTGSGLFLIDQISASPAFDHPVSIPEGFPGQEISVPAPTDGKLYMKLHDAPDVVNDVRVPRRTASHATDVSSSHKGSSASVTPPAQIHLTPAREAGG